MEWTSILADVAISVVAVGGLIAAAVVGIVMLGGLDPLPDYSRYWQSRGPQLPTAPAAPPPSSSPEQSS